MAWFDWSSVTRDEVLRRLAVRPSDFVVDIGSGNRPFAGASLLVEKYPFAYSPHRNQPMLFTRVPIIIADAMSLPFPDDSCDLICASHVIEHLDDPAAFLAELRRCSTHIYLEFPARRRELMFAWAFHAWLIEAEGGVLRFYRNDLPQFFGGFFHEEFDAALGAWSEHRHEYLNTSIHARADELRCEFPAETATELLTRTSARGERKVDVAKVINRPRYSLREILALVAQSVLSRRAYDRLASRSRLSRQPPDLPDSIVARLMCLSCRQASLRRTGGTIRCRCGVEYLQNSGIFDFDRVS